MKKSTLATAILLTTLSTAIIMPAAYADDTAVTGTSQDATGTTDTTTTPDTTTAPDTTTTTPDTTTAPDSDASDASDDNGS